MSEVAFKGMLLILEECLSKELQNHQSFGHFVKALGFHTVFFWKKAVPIIYNSDLQYGTNYREALLFRDHSSLTLYDVNEGHNRLRELFAAVPGLRASLLGRHAKRFEEQFHHLLQRRSSYSSLANSCQASDVDSNDLQNPDDLDEDVSVVSGSIRSGSVAGSGGNVPPAPPLPPVLCPGGDRSDMRPCNNRKQSECASTMSNGAQLEPLEEHAEPETKEEEEEAAKKQDSVDIEITVGSAETEDAASTTRSPGSSGVALDPPDTIIGGGLSSGQFHNRVINVSNAPPVSLKQAESGEWQIGQGSGGLVACCDPVMNENPDNVWLACFGPNAPLTNGSASPALSKTSTNSLGLPLISKPNPSCRIELLHDPRKAEDDLKTEIGNQMSLLGVLKNYNKDNYNLNPVQVPEEDYNVYYGGISNGLLWPALHNLAEYIVKGPLQKFHRPIE